MKRKRVMPNEAERKEARECASVFSLLFCAFLFVCVAADMRTCACFLSGSREKKCLFCFVFKAQLLSACVLGFVLHLQDERGQRARVKGQGSRDEGSHVGDGHTGDT